MNVEKLSSLAATPRPITPELMKVCGKPFFFLRKACRAWEDYMQHGAVVYAAVVQANGCLYSPEESRWAPAVVVFSTDPLTALDGGWITGMADRIQSSTPRNSAEAEVKAQLADEESTLEGPVPESLTGGVSAFFSTLYVNPNLLPGRCIPEHGLLPILVGQDGNRTNLVPPDLYA
jgi:hypothetical protein